ncbi:MAG TPA: DUF3501 family protein [Roseateles sp.]|nr:DUF3501 family protein [Roseateles sp.]
MPKLELGDLQALGRHAIQCEIDAYAPLVPDGTNWKATLLIAYPDPQERKRKRELIGLVGRLLVEVEGHARFYAMAAAAQASLAVDLCG